MAPRTVSVSRDDLLRRRTEIFERLEMTPDEFQRRAERGALVGEEWLLAEDLEGINFLLDENVG